MLKNEKKTEKLTRQFLLEVGIYDNNDFIIENKKVIILLFKSCLKMLASLVSVLANRNLLCVKKMIMNF